MTLAEAAAVMQALGFRNDKGTVLGKHSRQGAGKRGEALGAASDCEDMGASSEGI